jgi:hypothetical protein
MNISENGQFNGKNIIFAGYGIEDSNYSDYAGLDVTGKVVVFFTGEPKENGKYIISGTNNNTVWSWAGAGKKIALAGLKGAIGAFIINPGQPTFTARTIETNRKTNVSYPRKNKDSITINHVLLSHAFAATIIQKKF